MYSGPTVHILCVSCKTLVVVCPKHAFMPCWITVLYVAMVLSSVHLYIEAFNTSILVHSKISANLLNLHAECYLRRSAQKLVIFIVAQYFFYTVFPGYTPLLCCACAYVFFLWFCQ